MLNRHTTSEFMDLVDMTEAVAAGLILDPIYRPEIALEDQEVDERVPQMDINAGMPRVTYPIGSIL